MGNISHASSDLLNLRVNLGFGGFYELPKSLLIVHSQVRKHFTVYFNACLFQAVNKFAVRDAVNSGCRVNSGDPQLAEFSLFGPPVSVSISQRFKHLFVGRSEQFTFCTPVTFSQFKYFLCLLRVVTPPLTLGILLPPLYRLFPEQCPSKPRD